ncbi:MAG: prepilin-type N-terminal cleavage/methylation domain-containing protein [Trueperaceae bacterium]
MPSSAAPPRTGPSRVHSARRGVTLIELLVVLAVLAVLGGALAWAWRPSSVWRSAEAYRTLVRSARIAALAGTPTSVRYQVGERRFVARRDDADRGHLPCEGTVTGGITPESRVAVTRTLRSGVVWRPDGTGRSCGGGGVYGGRIRFEGSDGERVDVVVASTGRLRIERVEDGAP